MIHRTIAITRRFPWLDLAMAGTVLILLLSAACSGASRAAIHSPAAQSGGAAAPMPLGMTMTADPSATATTTDGAGNQVSIQNFSFGPGTIAISAGATVTWTNNDSVTHTVTAMDGSFNSSNLAPGRQFSFTFTSPGTYAYHCSIHPFMTGQVVVQ
jgi:plastocyanin